jgi:hypothetical protein
LDLTFIKNVLKVPTEKIQSDLIDIKAPSLTGKNGHEVRNSVYFHDVVGREFFWTRVFSKRSAR